MRADVIPQLADAAEVLAGIDVPEDVAVSVLIPNERGLRERARAAHGPLPRDQRLPVGASETHNRKNVNRSIEESLDGLERVLGRAREEGLRCEGVISVAFGCPYEGHVAPERVFEIAGRLARAGARGGRLRRHDRDGQPAAGARVLRAGARARSAPASS